LSEKFQQSIYQKIDTAWRESGALPEYVEAMRLALPDNVVHPEPVRDPVGWAVLPGLCCRAAGGDPGWAEPVAAAWFLIYLAAHLFDSIQDQDEPEPWWRELGVGAAINVASGLVVSGFSVLNDLYKLPNHHQAAGDVIARFCAMGLQMSSGQHRDLITAQPGVEEWFEIAEAKSGTFFGLACWAGARLATDDAKRLQGFSEYGSLLGILLQIHDDLDDLRRMKAEGETGLIKGITRSLPVAYALEVCPEEMRNRLLSDLQQVQDTKEAILNLVDLLDQIGAALFLNIQIELCQQRARSALDKAGPDPSNREALITLLRELEGKKLDMGDNIVNK
jgi:geranylgeranyl pyrophosphate synthase